MMKLTRAEAEELGLVEPDDQEAIDEAKAEIRRLVAEVKRLEAAALTTGDE